MFFQCLFPFSGACGLDPFVFMRNPSHTLNRARICLVCCQRATSVITSTLLAVIRTFLIQGFCLENERFPSGLCTTCWITISGFGTGDFTRSLPPWFGLSPMATFLLNRNPKDHCDCLICSIAFDYCKFGARSSKRKVGGDRRRRPQSAVESKGSTIVAMICVKCLTTIRPGSPHRCNSNSRFQNVMKLCPIKTLDLPLDRVAGGVVKNKLNWNNGHARFSSGGRAFNIQRQEAQVARCLDLNKVKEMRVTNHLSLNQTEGILKYFQSAMGRKAVEPYAKLHLQKCNSQFSSFFIQMKIQFIFIQMIFGICKTVMELVAFFNKYGWNSIWNCKSFVVSFNELVILLT